MKNIIPHTIKCFARLYPWVRGRNFIVRHITRHGLYHRVIKATGNPCHSRFGVVVHCLEGDYTSDLIRFYGDYEPTTFREIRQSVRPDTIFLDVGANVGIFTLATAYKNPSIKVISFEPNRELRQLINRSVHDNLLQDRIEVCSEALSDTDGFLHFDVPNGHSGKGRMRLNDEITDASSFKVKMMKMDDHPSIRSRSMPISTIKIDVEGAEMHVLKGARQTLMKDRPRVIIEGYNSQLEAFGSSCSEMIDWFNSIGYRQWRKWDGNYYFEPKQS